MKHLFIVNPVAGGKDRSEEVKKEASAIFASREDDFEVYVTKGVMDAAEAIRRRAETGEEFRVYSCGGDGTFNECVNGAACRSNIAVAPYPVGTGNDFCRMFGEEQDLYRDLKALVNGSVHRIDAIDCNGRYCVNIASVGIDARIGCNVHKYTSLPLVGGATGYVISAIVEMFRGISMPVKIRCGDYYSEEKKTLACVCNGRFYGGGFNPSVVSMPDDGILDIIVVKSANLFTFAKLIGHYSKGRLDKLGNLADVMQGQEISFEFDEEQVINIDGESIYADKVNMKLVPGCVQLIVPEGMSYFG